MWWVVSEYVGFAWINTRPFRFSGEPRCRNYATALLGCDPNWNARNERFYFRLPRRAAGSSRYDRTYILLRESSYTPVHQRTSDNPPQNTLSRNSYLVCARYVIQSYIHDTRPCFPSGLINSTYAHLHWVITRCRLPVSLSRDRYPTVASVWPRQYSRMIDQHLVWPNDSDPAVVIAHIIMTLMVVCGVCRLCDG